MIKLEAELRDAQEALERAQAKVAELAFAVATERKRSETQPEQPSADVPLSPMASALVAAVRYTTENREPVDVGGVSHRPVG